MLDEEQQSSWQIWLVRVFVTAAIILAFEYWYKLPPPQSRNDQSAGGGYEGSATFEYRELPTEVKVDDIDKKTGEAAASVPTEANTESDQQSEKSAVDANEQVIDEFRGLEKNGKLANAANVFDNHQNENESPQPRIPLDSSNEMDSLGWSMTGTEKQQAFLNSSQDVTLTPEANPNSDEQRRTVKFKNKSSRHPGMTGFHSWYDIETSLYRQYHVGRTDGVEVIPPYQPQSRRGTVKVNLRVTNELTQDAQVIDVYWINYKGNEEQKGRITPGETWFQQTWVEHPWVFRLSDSQDLLLHYIPERVIQHLEEAPTCDEKDPYTGQHVFIFRPPIAQAERDHHICSIIDPILPHPASHHFHNPNEAHTWTLLHMKRQEYFSYNPDAVLLTKYLTNIAMNPSKANYRQIRIANKNFFQSIWQTSARGLLLAVGFVEQNAYAEMGTEEPLPSDRVQDVSLALFRLEQAKIQLQQEASQVTRSRQQPDGADGSGRAGYGRAGGMSIGR